MCVRSLLLCPSRLRTSVRFPGGKRSGRRLGGTPKPPPNRAPPSLDSPAGWEPERSVGSLAGSGAVGGWGVPPSPHQRGLRPLWTLPSDGSTSGMRVPGGKRSGKGLVVYPESPHQRGLSLLWTLPPDGAVATVGRTGRGGSRAAPNKTERRGGNVGFPVGADLRSLSSWTQAVAHLREGAPRRGVGAPLRGRSALRRLARVRSVRFPGGKRSGGGLGGNPQSPHQRGLRPLWTFPPEESLSGSAGSITASGAVKGWGIPQAPTKEGCAVSGLSPSMVQSCALVGGRRLGSSMSRADVR